MIYWKQYKKQQPKSGAGDLMKGNARKEILKSRCHLKLKTFRFYLSAPNEEFNYFQFIETIAFDELTYL